MSTLMFLIRHGAHARLGKVLCGRMDGVSLGEDGRRQAEAVAQRLSGSGIAAVYSSPLERTRQTAEPLARACGLEVELDRDLLEIDYGEWTGESFEALHADPRWALWNRERLAHRPPGGESMQEAQARAVGWMDRMLARHPEQSIAAVSHGDVIKGALAHALGLPLANHHCFDVSPGSISAVAAGDWGFKALSINEVPACPQ